MYLQQWMCWACGANADGAVLLWSSNALAATFALAGLTVFQLLTLQFGAATLVLAAVRARRSRRGTVDTRVRPRDIPVGLVGLTGTIVLQYLAFASASIVAANVLSYAWPLLVAVWAAVAYRGRQTLLGRRLAATLLLIRASPKSRPRRVPSPLSIKR